MRMPSFSCRDDTNTHVVRFPATIECDKCKEEFPIVLLVTFFFFFFFSVALCRKYGDYKQKSTMSSISVPIQDYTGQLLGRKAKITAPSLNNLRIIQLLMQSWGGSTESSKNCSKFVINIFLILIITVNFSLFFVLFLLLLLLLFFFFCYSVVVMRWNISILVPFSPYSYCILENLS